MQIIMPNNILPVIVKRINNLFINFKNNQNNPRN